MTLPVIKATPKNKSEADEDDYCPEFIVEQLMDAWDDLQDKLSNLNEEDKTKIEEHFNNLIEYEDDLGTVLFGTADNFETRFLFLNDKSMDSYTKEIMSQNVIDIWRHRHI